MIYILETKLLESKSVFFELTKVYGIGKKTAEVICKKSGFSLNLKIKNLTLEQVSDIIKTIHSMGLVLNNDLKKIKFLSIQKLISIKCYRGLRRIKGFPVRGQRTHSNAKSARLNKRVV